MSEKKQELRLKRHRKIRKKILSTRSPRLRLVVFRSLNNIYAQIIDDEKSATLAESSDIKMKKTGNKIQNAKQVGKTIAEKALEKGIKEIAFDRNGYKYHGRVKALADAARETGLIF